MLESQTVVTMPWGRTLSLCALAVLFQLSLGEYTILGDTFTFTAHEECSGGFPLTLQRLQRDASRQDVASRIDGVWMPAEPYKDRVQPDSALSVNLTDVNIRDGGAYEFSCRGSLVGRPIQLEVVVPVDSSAAAGGKVKLPCHSSAQVESVRWERDGGLVFEQDQPSKEKHYGKAFHGRVSVSPDGDAKGDFSLTLERVQPEDRGVYICYIITGEDGQWSRRGPAAVRLVVTGNETAKPTPMVPENEGMPTRDIIIVIVSVFVTFIVTTIGLLGIQALFRWLHSGSSSFTTASGGGQDKALLPREEPAQSPNP